jgi:hypothetical protein
MSNEAKISFSVDIEESKVAAAVISAVAHGMKKNMFQDRVQGYVALAMREFFESNPDLEKRIRRIIDTAIEARVEQAMYRALLAADRKIKETMSGKVWCEAHGAVDPVLGCAVCQQDEAEAPRGTCTTGVEEEKP